MDGTFYYYILKNYKGALIKKHKNNTHLFFIPVDPKKYMYVAIVGEMLEEDTNLEKSYASQLLVRLSEDILDNTISGEQEYFGNRFIKIEELRCKSSAQSPGVYEITFPKKGFHILSDLQIEYQIEYSSSERRIYLIKGDLNLETQEIKEKELGMVAAKQVAYMGKKDRFIEMKKFKSQRGKIYYD